MGFVAQGGTTNSSPYINEKDIAPMEFLIFIL